MSIHAYTLNKLGEKICLNSSQWSPAELIEGWHIPASEEVEQIIAEGREQSLITSNDILICYGRKQFINRFRELKERRYAKEPPIKKKQVVNDLPQGDIAFGNS